MNILISIYFLIAILSWLVILLLFAVTEGVHGASEVYDTDFPWGDRTWRGIVEEGTVACLACPLLPLLPSSLSQLPACSFCLLSLTYTILFCSVCQNPPRSRMFLWH